MDLLCLKENSMFLVPFGRPRCAQIAMRAPDDFSAFIVGMLCSILKESVILPSTICTLKSSLNKTNFPRKSKFSIVRSFIFFYPFLYRFITFSIMFVYTIFINCLQMICRWITRIFFPTIHRKLI